MARSACGAIASAKGHFFDGWDRSVPEDGTRTHVPSTSRERQKRERPEYKSSAPRQDLILAMPGCPLQASRNASAIHSRRTIEAVRPRFTVFAKNGVSCTTLCEQRFDVFPVHKCLCSVQTKDTLITRNQLPIDILAMKPYSSGFDNDDVGNPHPLARLQLLEQSRHPVSICILCYLGGFDAICICGPLKS